MQTVKINEQVSVGGQPSEEQLQELVQDGFRSVVNFRTEGEEDQPLSPAEEGSVVERLGLIYVHIPVISGAIEPDAVDQFRAKLPELPKPIFAHCKGGTRAGAMVMMHVACEQQINGKQALDEADHLGIKLNQAQLRQSIMQYVDRHTTHDAWGT